MADASDYLALITSEHSDKPRFMATVAASVQPLVDALSTLQAMPGAFDLDQAQGAQLDIIGQWVGVSRFFSAPLVDVYFSFDTEGLGFDQGYFQGPFDPSFGLERLDDPHYLILLRAKIALNHWDGTIVEAEGVLQTLLPGNYVSVMDDQDMSMSVCVTGPSLSAVTRALLVGGYLSVKPSTVQISDYLTSNVPDSPMFGFDSAGQVIAGFDTGAWAAPL